MLRDQARPHGFTALLGLWSMSEGALGLRRLREAYWCHRVTGPLAVRHMGVVTRGTGDRGLPGGRREGLCWERAGAVMGWGQRGTQWQGTKHPGEAPAGQNRCPRALLPSLANQPACTAPWPPPSWPQRPPWRPSWRAPCSSAQGGPPTPGPRPWLGRGQSLAGGSEEASPWGWLSDEGQDLSPLSPSWSTGPPRGPSPWRGQGSVSL